MRHCLLMTCYKKPEMINYFISTLPENVDIYIHIDRKSDFGIKDINSKAHVYKQYKVYWGSENHVKAFLLLMKAAYENGDYDYYHLITGEDFWAYSPTKIDALFPDDKTIYMECKPLPDAGWWWGGLEILQYRTLATYCNVKKHARLNSYFHAIQKYLHLGRKLPQYPLCRGSVYCSLPKEAVDYILSSDMTNDMLRRIRNTTNGEEEFFQTILMNSPLAKKIKSTNRYITWNEEHKIWAKYVDLNEIIPILNTRYLFFRKAKDAKQEAQILNIL